MVLPLKRQLDTIARKDTNGKSTGTPSTSSASAAGAQPVGLALSRQLVTEGGNGANRKGTSTSSTSSASAAGAARHASQSQRLVLVCKLEPFSDGVRHVSLPEFVLQKRSSGNFCLGVFKLRCHRASVHSSWVVRHSSQCVPELPDQYFPANCGGH